MNDEKDDWIKIQCKKYAGNNFGESKLVVEKNCLSWQNLLKYAKPNMSFLDLGCNDAFITYEMKKMGLKELGVDLLEVINKITYPINKIAMNLEKQFPEGKFDIILFVECLEHLRNGEDVCQKAINALDTNGVLIVTAPYSDEDFGKNCLEHHRLYKNNELRDLIIKCDGIIISEFQEKVRRSRGCVVKKRI